MRQYLPLAGPGFMLLSLIAFGISGAKEPTDDPIRGNQQPSATNRKEDSRQIEVARQRAKLLHEVYSVTLEVMHDRYFEDVRSIVPARALEDVFAEIDRQHGIKAHWIAVNTRAMSISHEPKTEFEKLAAKAIAAGRGELDEIKEGYYRRAAAITLDSSCIACHTGFFKEPPKKPLFAGLVISIPLPKE